MILPPTYFDYLKAARPKIIEAVEADILKLNGRFDGLGTIGSTDEYDSGFPEFLIDHVKKMNDDAIWLFSRQSGVSEREVAADCPNGIILGDDEIDLVSRGLSLEYHCLVNFALSGKKVFFIRDNLAKKLARTEVNLSTALIQAPFPSFMLTFTTKETIDALYAMQTNRDPAERIDYAAPISVFVTRRPAGQGLVGEKYVICAFHARIGRETYALFKREIYLKPDWSLEQALKTDWDQLTDMSEGSVRITALDNGEIERAERQDDSRFYTDGLQFYRTILNTILYLGSSAPELANRPTPQTEIDLRAAAATNDRKRHKILQEKARYTALNYVEVGASTPPISFADGEQGAGVSVRFAVRGHWRNQAHGPGRQDRKLVWIEPHYRGPDMAELVNKPYVAM